MGDKEETPSTNGNDGSDSNIDTEETEDIEIIEDPDTIGGEDVEDRQN